MKALVLKGCGKNLGFDTLVGSLQRVPERPLQKVKLPLQWGHQGSEDDKTMKCSPRTVSHCRADLTLRDKLYMLWMAEPEELGCPNSLET